MSEKDEGPPTDSHSDEMPTLTDQATAGPADVEKGHDQPVAPPAADPEGGPPKPSFGGGLTFPDGGLKAWMTVAGAWLVLFATFGYLNAYGVYEDYYLTHYLPDKSSADLAWPGSLQVCLLFAMGLISGKLFDEGYFHYMLFAGSVLYVFCLMMVSLSTSYYSIILSQGVGLGIANGLIFLPSIGAVSHHFFKRRALATGIVVTGSSVGGIVFPIMLNNLLKTTSFGWAVRATAFLILGCLVLANLLMRTRLPPRKKRPPHMQFKPDFKGILTDVPYLINTAGATLVMFGLFYPFFYLQLFASSHNLGEGISFYSLTILNAASVFGRTLPNFLADKVGPFNMIIPCVFMTSILMFVLLACGSVAGIICFALFFGFFSGAYVSLLPSVTASFARNVGEVGVRMGLSFAVVGLAALLGTPISGWLIGNGPDFHWWRASTFSGIVSLAGLSLMCVARVMHARTKGTQKV